MTYIVMLKRQSTGTLLELIIGVPPILEITQHLEWLKIHVYKDYPGFQIVDHTITHVEEADL